MISIIMFNKSSVIMARFWSFVFMYKILLKLCSSVSKKWSIVFVKNIKKTVYIVGVLFLLKSFSYMTLLKILVQKNQFCSYCCRHILKKIFAMFETIIFLWPTWKAVYYSFPFIWFPIVPYFLYLLDYLINRSELF